MAAAGQRMFEHSFVPLTWSWEDPLPSPSCWRPMTEMQDERVRLEYRFVWLNLNGHREFNLLVVDEASGLRLYENRRVERRVLVRRIGGQVNLSVHASLLASRGIVRPHVFF